MLLTPPSTASCMRLTKTPSGTVFFAASTAGAKTEEPIKSSIEVSPVASPKISFIGVPKISGAICKLASVASRNALA